MTTDKQDPRIASVTCPICDSSKRWSVLCYECNAKLTKEQSHLLQHNQHLLPVAFLPDDDLLVLDSDSPDYDRDPYGPYVLDQQGHLQLLNRHYASQHGLPVYPGPSRPTSPYNTK